VAVGGTDADFWREQAAKVDPLRLAAAQRDERLYCAAARMLTAQGPAATRAGWPELRRQRWHALELLLSTDPPANSAGAGWPVAPDPSVHLASRLDATGAPVSVAAAVRDWESRLSETAGGLVALPRLLYAVVTELLEELVGRLAPGRPVGAVGNDGAMLGALATDLADQLRVPAEGVPRSPSRPYPGRSRPDPQPIAT